MALAGMPDVSGSINQLKDILQTYNRVTESCFKRCASNFNYRSLTPDEVSCVDSCGSKFVNGNQRIMTTFVEIQSRKQQQLADEALKQQQNLAADQTLPDIRIENQQPLTSDLKDVNTAVSASGTLPSTLPPSSK